MTWKETELEHLKKISETLKSLSKGNDALCGNLRAITQELFEIKNILNKKLNDWLYGDKDMDAYTQSILEDTNKILENLSKSNGAICTHLQAITQELLEIKNMLNKKLND